MQTIVDGEEALLFSLQIYGFAICGSIIKYVGICDLRTGTSQKFAGFAIAPAMSPRICGPTFAVQCYDAYRVPNFFLPALHDTQSPFVNLLKLLKLYS